MTNSFNANENVFASLFEPFRRFDLAKDNILKFSILGTAIEIVSKNSDRFFFLNVTLHPTKAPFLNFHVNTFFEDNVAIHFWLVNNSIAKKKTNAFFLLNPTSLREKFNVPLLKGTSLCLKDLVDTLDLLETY